LAGVRIEAQMPLEDQPKWSSWCCVKEAFSLLSCLLSPSRGLGDDGSRWAVCSTDLGLRARVIKVTDRVCIPSPVLAFSVAPS